jgi:hypothetical protein
MPTFKRVATTAAITVVTVLCFSASAQSIVEHPASWFGEAGRAFFFRLDGSGGRLFVNRSTTSGGEELVEVPSTGGTALIWYANPRREIFNRIAVSSDGKTLAFAKGTSARVYVLASAAASPITVADVSPDGDPRQLELSRDGRWIAFTASGVEGGGPIGRVRVNLYVAATNGSAVHRITSAPLVGKHIAFALSEDGGTLIWVDDPTKGPIVSERDGSGATRLPVPAGRILRVHSAADGERLYCTTVGASTVRLYSIARAGSNWTLEDEASDGAFAVAPETGAIRLVQRPGQTSPGTCWSVGESSRTSMFTFEAPRRAGSLAMSGDGKVVVWREGLKTRVWQARP